MDTAWFGDRTDGIFTFCAQWEAADRFVNYMGNEADNKEDYYQSYSAASENRFNKLDFKKTGYTAGSNWVYKDQFMNTAGSYVGDVRKCEKAAPGHKKSSESFISHIQILLIHV